MTIREIAEYYGVAPSTVSVVLNSRPGVRKEMREKIKKTLIANGYTIRQKQNTPQRNILFVYYRTTDYLSARKDNTIASIISGIDNIVAENDNYAFSVMNATSENLSSILRTAHEKYKGIILLGTEYYTDPIDEFFNIPIPLVVLDGYFPEYGLNTVNIDNSYGVYQAIRLLKDNGHKRIGYLKSSIEFGCLRDRTMQIHAALKDLLDTKPDPIILVDQVPAEIQEEVHQYIKKEDPESLPTAFIADNDIIAASAIQIFLEEGYKIPDDLSIIGFDNSEICNIVTPHLTTVNADLQEMARYATQRVISLIENPSECFIKAYIGTSLIQRETVGPARKNFI